MCETRDFGILWPPCFFERQVVVEMRVVCPQDVKNMLLRQTLLAYWKKLAATHDCE